MERIFRVVLEVASVARVAREVDAAGEHDVEASAAGFAPDADSTLTRDLGIERRADQDGRRERGCAGVVRAIAGVRDTHAGVAALQRGDPEPGHAGRIARAHCHFRGNQCMAVESDDGIPTHYADDEVEALLVGHQRFGLDGAGGCVTTITRVRSGLLPLGAMCYTEGEEDSQPEPGASHES